MAHDCRRSWSLGGRRLIALSLTAGAMCATTGGVIASRARFPSGCLVGDTTRWQGGTVGVYDYGILCYDYRVVWVADDGSRLEILYWGRDEHLAPKLVVQRESLTVFDGDRSVTFADVDPRR